MWSRDLLVGLATAAAAGCVAPRNYPAPDVPAKCASLLPVEPTSAPATSRAAPGKTVWWRSPWGVRGGGPERVVRVRNATKRSTL